MPDDYPGYLSHDQVLAYQRSYARHFGIYEHIQFHTAVEKIFGVLGTPSPTSLDNLGFLLQAQGDLAGARPLCERALLALLTYAIGA